MKFAKLVLLLCALFISNVVKTTKERVGLSFAVHEDAIRSPLQKFFPDTIKMLNALKVPTQEFTVVESPFEAFRSLVKVENIFVHQLRGANVLKSCQNIPADIPALFLHVTQQFFNASALHSVP